MNNSPRNNDNCFKTQLEHFSDDTILEVLPVKSDEDVSVKYVLIKHDYYSTDSDHGRELLSSFLSSLLSSSFNSIILYLIDKGTKLLDEHNPLFTISNRLIQKSEMVVVDQDSITEYSVNVCKDTKLIYQSSSAITEDVIAIPNLLILE